MKKLNPQQIARWGSLASLAMLAVVFTQCIAQPAKKGVATSNYEVSSPGGLEAAEAEAPSVGVKDADRILYSMAAVTGIDPATNATIRNAYTNLKPQLPGTSRIDSLTDNQMVSVTKLAAEFCNQLVGNGALTAQRSMVWPRTAVNTNTTWTSVFGTNPESAQRINFITDTIAAFWGANVLDDQQVEDSGTNMLELLSLMLEGDPTANPAIMPAADNQTSKQNAAKAVCTAALASAPVWMN